MQKTAIKMPTVRKIRCQYGFIFCSTVAFTTALSKDSDSLGVGEDGDDSGYISSAENPGGNDTDDGDCNWKPEQRQH